MTRSTKLLSGMYRKNENTLVLCLLGPTATVLAYDLFKAGYRFIDLGHVDIEYEWYRMGVVWKEIVHGKSVNECGKNTPDEPISTDEYEAQIIARIL